MTMTNPKPDPRHLKVLFALERMPRALLSDVLADGAIAKRFGLTLINPIRLGDQAFRRANVFEAFQAATDGAPVPALVDENNAPVEVRISIDDQGDGHLEIGARDWRFPHAALLCTDLVKRMKVLEVCLSKHTLVQRDEAELREIVSRTKFSHDDFFKVVTTLSSSPESFAENLKLGKQQIGMRDLLPEDARHWENLTAVHKSSASLREFVENELAAERRARLAKEPVQGFSSISLTFPAPALVPVAALAETNADAVIAMIESALQVDDHFALIGAFEICCDWIPRDGRFLILGEQLLDRLFSDMDRLITACGIFSAAFVITMPYLSEHERLRRRPAYWRRLAASAHASLVVRAWGVRGVNQDELVSWAIRVSGLRYFLSVLLDMGVEPQWRPDWILPDFLVGDVYGRARSAFHGISAESAPESWKQRINRADDWIVKKNQQALTMFPAVLEGARRAKSPTPAELNERIKQYRDFEADPSVANLVSLGPAIHIFGFPPDGLSYIRSSLDRLRNLPSGMDDRETQIALMLAGHVAVFFNDASLANDIAELCLEKARGVKHKWSLFEAVSRLVECATADPDRDKARRELARRLESLAFSLPMSELMDAFVEALQILKQIDPDLAPFLGRALATAKLGLRPLTRIRHSAA